MKNHLITAGLCLALSLPAQAAIITFNNTAASGDFESFSPGTAYSETGFRVDAISGVLNFLDHDFDSGGVGNANDLAPFDDDVLEFDSIGATVDIARVGGGLFDALAVDIGQLDMVGGLQLTAFLGSSVVGSLALNSCGDACVTNFVLGLRGIDRLRFEATALFPIIDNLSLVPAGVTAVSEPLSAALLAVGMLALIGRRRRQRWVS